MESNNYEEKIINFWKKNKIYEKVKEKNKGKTLFNSIDGPPYPTGNVHMGHARNWAIKDTVFRYKRLKGYDVYIRDGYDAHGLPVENKTQKKLGLKTVDDIKKFGIDNFTKECRKYALSIINDMNYMRDRFGLWMDRNYYYTFHPEYISMSWRFFKKAEEKGLLYKGYKTVAWCPHDETTLSDYEVKDSYQILKDPSVYVKFPIRKEYKTTEYEESLLIWTTTPWTLQSNLAIAVHPEFDYSKVLVELNNKKEVLIIATKLVDSVIKQLSKQQNIKLLETLEVLKGSELEGIKYNHILFNETESLKEFDEKKHKLLFSVVLADYVTLGEGDDYLEKLEKRGYKHEGNEENKTEEIKVNNKKSEGTGLVHTAPGHGFDDYNTGIKYNLPIFCPVDERGRFTEGLYKGEYFRDSNHKFIEYLTNKGYMLYSDYKEHKYPTCWRCKTPIVYRAAEQWWIRREKYKEDIIKNNQNVKWFPKYAKNNFNNLFKNVGDWPISRQRFWGIPLPIWECKNCKKYIVINSKEDLEKRTGKKFEDLHLDSLRGISFDCECGSKKELVGYIADVWFDSGCASFASHYEEGLSFEEILEKYYPIKWVTEGEDQIRGWFSSLFNVGQVVTDKAPYREVLFYKYVMDKEGRKMSKSLGNGLDMIDAIRNFGADLTRFYLVTKRLPEEQINLDVDEIKKYKSFFITLKNINKYINSYLKNYTIKSNLIFENLKIEDKWVIYRFNKTLKEAELEIENYRLNVGFKKIEEFITKDVSKIYLKFIKDRTENFNESLYYTFNYLLKNMLIAFSPVIPFITEELYLNSNLENKKESIFLEDYPEIDKYIIQKSEKEKLDENFEISLNIIQSILNIREKVGIGVRWPLSEVIFFTSKGLEKDLEELILKQTNIKKLTYNRDIGIRYKVKPNFKEIKEDFFENTGEIIKLINENSDKISKFIKNNSKSINLGNYEIDLEKHILAEKIVPDGYLGNEFSNGFLIVNVKQDEILLEEGYLRELIRRVQQLRKENNLKKEDPILLSFVGSDDYYLNLVKNLENIIKKRVNAKEFTYEDLGNKSYEIKDKKLSVGLKKL